MIKKIDVKNILSIILFSANLFAQTISVEINGIKTDKIILSSLSGERVTERDSVINFTGNKITLPLHKKYSMGIYRLSFSKSSVLDFINDGKDVELKTDMKNILDSMKVISSESNKLFYQFIKLNKQYKTKNELLQLILARFPKDDSYYSETKKRLQELQNEYIEFVNITAQKDPTAFIAKYIRSSQLPIIDSEIPSDKQLDYLKTHALVNVNFREGSLINSDCFTNKTIEYLTYFRNPQLPKELLEKEFMKAVDTLLNKAKVHQLVYQHITEYLIDGFKKFGFDTVLDYIVENYVIKDDLCLDVKTEGMIKRRIEQAKMFKIGAIVKNIVLPDISGNQIELNKMNSEKVLIVFYSSVCPHCKELLPKLNNIKKQQGSKLEIMAISLDSKKQDWESFVQMNCQSIINVSDLKGWDGKTADDYFIYATPTMFLVDRNKKIILKPTKYEEISKSLFN